MADSGGGRGVVERDDRSVNFVFLNRFDDEFRYLFECSYFEDQRRMYLPRDLSRHANTVSFKTLMNTWNLPALFKLGKFCKENLSTFKVIYGHA